MLVLWQSLHNDLSWRRWGGVMVAILLVSGVLGVVFLRSDRPAFQARIVRSKIIPPPVLNTGPLVAPLPPDINRWPTSYEEYFDTNKHHWGLGTKDDGTALLKRRMVAGAYYLQLTPTITNFVFLGGNSTYFAPTIYYLSVDFKKTWGDEHADCGVLFDEISDAQFSMFHIHDDLQQFSIDQVVDGGTWNQHLPDHVASTVIRPGDWNTLGVLADGDQFSFYINDTKVAQVPMIRVQRGLLDVAIAGRTPNEPAVCQFDNFIVRVPR
jgi:hypothetical protein